MPTNPYIKFKSVQISALTIGDEIELTNGLLTIVKIEWLYKTNEIRLEFLSSSGEQLTQIFHRSDWIEVRQSALRSDFVQVRAKDLRVGDMSVDNHIVIRLSREGLKLRVLWQSEDNRRQEHIYIGHELISVQR